MTGRETTGRAAEGVPPVLEARGLSKSFGPLAAVRGVSLAVAPGECLGLVGRSGSGKSTVAGMVSGLIAPDAGQIVVEGRDVTRARGREAAWLHSRVQMVFQDARGSFDPRRTLGDGVEDGLRAFGASRAEARRRAVEMLERCGLPAEFHARFPHEASGGQCQRAAIARALARSPSLLVCDEATSALDVTVQRGVVELLERLREESGMAVLFICHDMALVSEVCDRVCVMDAGEAVEEGPVEGVLAHPEAPATKALLAAVL